MYKYELAHIIACESKSDEEIQKIIGNVREFIAEVKGRIVKEDVWGKKDLAYPIKKQNYGFYMFTTVIMDPDNVAELEKKLRLMEGSLRYLIINLDREPGYDENEKAPLMVAEKETTDKVEEEIKKDVVKEEKPIEKKKQVATKAEPEKSKSTDKEEEATAEVEDKKEEVKEKAEKETAKKDEKTVDKPEPKAKTKIADEKEKKEKEKDTESGDDLDKLLEEIL